MIKFRTEIDLPEFRKKMGYRQHSMMIGSCFAENIGTYLQEYCFPISVNPFGILYNPISIANSLEYLISGRIFTEADLFYSNGLYHSFSHHSRFSGSNPEESLKQINACVADASEGIKNCSHLFVTFGTSMVFKHKPDGSIVSNCHKLPSTLFDHYRLSVEQITEIWNPLIDRLHRMNPRLQLVFTVSPIRHLKDGAHMNQLSKSTLLLAIDILNSRYGDDLISYFPAYELMLDELRDYRFYDTDMTHPGELAIDFISEKFVAALLDSESMAVMTDLSKILPALKHRQLNNNNIEYKAFILNQIKKTDQLQEKYPFADFKLVIKKLYEKIPD